MKRARVKVRLPPPPTPQDWKEQYIHENYSRALEGEGFVEQVSPTQDPDPSHGHHPLGPPPGLVVPQGFLLRQDEGKG